MESSTQMSRILMICFLNEATRKDEAGLGWMEIEMGRGGGIFIALGRFFWSGWFRL